MEWNIGAVLSSRPDDHGIQPLFIPVGQDIIDFGFSMGTSQSNISYITEGAVGVRILKIEWKNVGFFDDSTESDFMNFQMWLHEGTNVIEYRYGPSEINNPSGSFEEATGLAVQLATSINMDNGELEDTAYILKGNPGNPSLIIIAPGIPDPGFEDTLDGMVTDGTVYRFTPQPLSVEDFSNISFELYPIPTNEFLNIKSVFADYKTSIYNSLGQRMKTELQGQRLDVSEFTSGVYSIKFETEKGSVTKKFIKQ